MRTDPYDNPRGDSYIVPCVFKAIQLVELLRAHRAGLSVEDLLKITGYSRSTTYRILRTLTACRYAFRNEGTYRLNQKVVNPIDGADPRTTAAEASQTDQREPCEMLGFERWGVHFHPKGCHLLRGRPANERQKR